MNPGEIVALTQLINRAAMSAAEKLWVTELLNRLMVLIAQQDEA